MVWADPIMIQPSKDVVYSPRRQLACVWIPTLITHASYSNGASFLKIATHPCAAHVACSPAAPLPCRRLFHRMLY